MKAKFILASFAIGVTTTSEAAQVILGFNSIAMEAGSSTTFSSTGDVWRASNARLSPGGQMDVLFTITAAAGITPDSVGFVNESGRGNNMRIRMGQTINISNAAVFINIRFVNPGTSQDFSGWQTGDELVTQFSDLDSDLGADRADFAGAETGEFSSIFTSDDISPGSSFLEISSAPSFAPLFTVGIMEPPWSSQPNITATDALSQSPVTVRFNHAMDIEGGIFRNSINIVVGQRSGGAAANRHVDIDMTPDFAIVPEPNSILLGVIGVSGLLLRRRSD